MTALARLPIARLSRTPRAWLGVGAWCLLALGLSIAARHAGTAHGADRVLLDGYGSFALPLLTYALVGAALGAGSVRASTTPLVVLGASPVRAALAAILVAAGGCAAAGAVLAAAVAAVAHGPGDPPALRDAVTSAYAGGLGGLAYASWYALGAAFGRRGGGRMVLLLVDFLASGDTGLIALVTPRAHVRNLLGGAGVMDLSGRASAGVLLAMALGFGALAIARVNRP